MYQSLWSHTPPAQPCGFRLFDTTLPLVSGPSAPAARARRGGPVHSPVLPDNAVKHPASPIQYPGEVIQAGLRAVQTEHVVRMVLDIRRHGYHLRALLPH